MTAIRSLTAKATVQSFLAILAALTVSYGFLFTDKVPAEAYMTLAGAAFLWAFPRASKDG